MLYQYHEWKKATGNGHFDIFSVQTGIQCRFPQQNLIKRNKMVEVPNYKFAIKPTWTASNSSPVHRNE